MGLGFFASGSCCGDCNPTLENVFFFFFFGFVGRRFFDSSAPTRARHRVRFLHLSLRPRRCRRLMPRT